MAKRLLDFVGGSLALLFFSPVLVIIAIWIRLDSPGPVFFIQERLGKSGRVFRMYKFRSMVENAEQMGDGLFSYAGDSRITRVGHFIRRSSLDELPQILNVIKGDMSMVGPRPPVSYELGDYEDFGPELLKRFEMKPGITGLAQVSGRNELGWERKLIYDNQYIDNFKRRGILEDLRIIVKTIGVVLAMKDTIEKKSTDG